MNKESDKTAPITKKDISEVFNEFYGKVIEPRFDRIESYIQNKIEPRFDQIDKKFEEQDKKFDDLLNHFDQICNRLDRLANISALRLPSKGTKKGWIELKETG